MRRYLACFLILTAFLPGVSHPAEWKDPCVLENEFIRAVIDRGRGATLRSLTNKQTGTEYAREFLSGREYIGGLAEDRIAGEPYGSEIVLLRYQGDPIHKQEVQTITLTCTPEIPKYRGWQFSKTFSLARRDAFLRVKWSIKNIGDTRRTVTPWVHNLVEKKFRNTLIAFPDGMHSVPPWDDYFRPAWRNWVGACSPSDQDAVWFCSESAKTMRQYYCHWNGYHSVEWAYIPANLNPGETWSTEYSISVGTPAGFPAAFCAEGALSFHIQNRKMTADFCPAVQIGKTEITLELNGIPCKKIAADIQIGKNVSMDFGPVSGRGNAAILLPGRQRLTFHYDADHADASTTPLPRLESLASPFRRISPSAVPAVSCGSLGNLGVYRVPFLHKIFEKDYPEEIGFLEEERVLRNSLFFRQVMLCNRGKETVRLKIARRGALPLSVRSVGFVETTEPSHLDEKLPVGRFPDPILPESGFVDVPAESSVSLMLEAFIPPDAPAGKHAWDVLLSGNGKSIKIPVACRVLEEALPPRSSLWSTIGCWHLKKSLLQEVGWSGGEEEFHRLCRELCYSHRLTPRENGMKWTLDENQKKKLLELRDRKHITSLIIPNYLLKKDENLAKACALLKETETLDRAFVYCFDEVPSAKFPEILGVCKRIHAIEPALTILGTIYENDVSPLYGEIGIWCRKIQDEPWREERRRRGDRFMSSNLLGTDMECPAEQSTLSLLSLRLNHCSGFLLWNIIGGAGGDNPWKSVACSGGNGNAHLLYPHATGPLPTIRWKHLAYGVKLYDMLNLLQGISPEDYRTVMQFAGKVSSAQEIAQLESMVLDALEKKSPLRQHGNGTGTGRAAK